MEWREVMIRLNKVLCKFSGCQAFLLRQDGKKVVVRLILDDTSHAKVLEQINNIDDLVRNAEPEMYLQHLFDYEVWDELEWRPQLLNRAIERKV